MSVFGPILIREDVEAAVQAHLENWLATYIAEVARQHGWADDYLAPIRNYTTVASGFEKWTEDQTPMVLIQSPGIEGAPVAEGGGSFRALWQVGIAAITSGGGADPGSDARKTSGAYFAAIRAAMIQRPALGELGARGVSWVSERYDEIPVDQERTLAASYGMFNVEVGEVLDRYGGVAAPLDNPLEPAPDPPDVETTDVEVTPDEV